MRHGWNKLWIVLMIFLLLIINIIWVKKERKFEIAEIPNTHVFATTNSIDYRFFVVSNPPESLDEFKQLLEGYITKYIEENTDNIHDGCLISWRFFRETHIINQNWVEGGGYFKEDHIEWHQDKDRIAFVYSVDGELVYHLLRKSTNLFDYGRVLDECYWPDD